MTYMINARLEEGIPSLTLTDAVTGEERLHWRGEGDLKGLFKRLILLSCADRISLVQRTKSPILGDECIECSTCVEQAAPMATHVTSANTISTGAKNSIVSLLKLQR